LLAVAVAVEVLPLQVVVALVDIFIQLRNQFLERSQFKLVVAVKVEKF
jgi:hypothetical protein